MSCKRREEERSSPREHHRHRCVIWKEELRPVLVSTAFRLLADSDQEKTYWFCLLSVNRGLINILCFKSLLCPHLLNIDESNFLQDVFPSRKLIS